jgi:hypothetical protein
MSGAAIGSSTRASSEWQAAGRSFDALPLLGINRFVLTADSDREGMALGRRAWPKFHANFMKLWKLHGTEPRFARMPEDFDTLVEHGGGIGAHRWRDPKIAMRYLAEPK